MSQAERRPPAREAVFFRETLAAELKATLAEVRALDAEERARNRVVLSVNLKDGLSPLQFTDHNARMFLATLYEQIDRASAAGLDHVSGVITRGEEQITYTISLSAWQRLGTAFEVTLGLPHRPPLVKAAAAEPLVALAAPRSTTTKVERDPETRDILSSETTYHY